MIGYNSTVLEVDALWVNGLHGDVIDAFTALVALICTSPFFWIINVYNMYWHIGSDFVSPESPQ